MRAVVCNEFGPPEKLSVEDRPDYEPGEGQVVVDVRAAGVNFVDVLFIQGKYQIRPEPPFVPGNEVSGVVAKLGPGVGSAKVGDRVIAMSGMNGFAERVVVPERGLIPLPEALDFERGAAVVQSYCTGLFALTRRCQVEAGETLLVLGAAGGVGLAAIDIGKSLGLRVIAAASTQEKLDLCRALGADETIDYSREDLKVRAKELSGGGVDVVYDPVGDQYAEPALRALAPRGRYLVIGFAAGEIPRVPFNLILLKSCQVIGVDWGGTASREKGLNAGLLAELTEGFASGRLNPPAPTSYPLERAGEALSDLMNRRLAGKAVLVP